MDPRAMVSRIYKEDYYTLLQTKYESSRPSGLGKKYFFFMFFSLYGPFLTSGAWLTGFIKRTTTHCYIQNMKALCLVVLEKRIFFKVFPILSLWELSVAMKNRVLIRPAQKIKRYK